jgi:hypothetical protein
MAGWSDQTIAKQSGHNLWYGKGAAPSWDTTAINKEPLFADTAAVDLRLRLTSPAIDAGIVTDNALDFDALSRPQGQGYDIGAFEYASPNGVRQNVATGQSVFSRDAIIVCTIVSSRQRIALPADARGFEVFDLLGKCIYRYNGKSGLGNHFSMQLPASLESGLLYVKPLR